MQNSAQNINITLNGLWLNNPGLVQLLGLCPLLAVTTSFVNGLGLGIATTITLLISNISVSLLRKFLIHEIRIPIFVLIIASAVTSIELIMKAYFYDLYLNLGIFIPLIVTNCAILGRAEAFASKNPVFPAMLDGLMMGLGFSLVLIVLGSMRELIAYGSLFSQLDLLFGTKLPEIKLENYKGFLLAALAPGAFIGLALIIAAKNFIDLRLKQIHNK